MSSENCPSRESLLQFSIGNLSEELSNELAEHLDSCSDCQSTIMNLEDAEDTVIVRLRTPLGEVASKVEPEFLAAMAKALAMSAHAGGSPEFLGDKETSAPPMPKTLGEYMILEELGHGGMGRVYKALHTKLDRIVAIKVLPRGRMEDSRATNRFAREMRAVGKLDHPNIVQAFDAREIDGTPVLIMEFIDGLDLAATVRRAGPLPVAEACELTRQTALALQCAHEHGLVHRDIKPSNVMLNLSGEVKLLDLGLARFYADAAAGDEMTGAGQLMGTVDYIAPEQASDSRTVSIRADLYSLGCSLYKLLCGRVPFHGPEYRGAFEKMNAHVNRTPPSIRQLAPNVPEELAAILNRLLAKNPADRFAEPAEVADALNPFCAHADLPELIQRAASLTGEFFIVGESEAGSQVLREIAKAKTEPIGDTNRELLKPAPLKKTARRRWIPIAVASVAVSVAAGFTLGILIKWKNEGGEKSVTVEVYGKTDHNHAAPPKIENPFDIAEDAPIAPVEIKGEPKDFSPLEKLEAESKTVTVEKEHESDDGHSQTVIADWSLSQAAPLPSPDTEWQIAVNGAPTADFQPKSVALPPKSDIFEDLCGMAISRAAKAAVVGYVQRTPGARDESSTRLFLCDLQSGRITVSGATQGELTPVALHGDGRQILLRSNEFGFGKQDLLAIGTLQGNKLVTSRAWMPYRDEQQASSRDVLWAEFVGANKVATCSHRGKVAIWDLDSVKPICYFQAGEDSVPALSPDGKWIAFAGVSILGMFDVEKQEVTAVRQTPCKLQRPKIAFSPSGRKIGCIASDRILVWDAASGKLENNFAPGGIHFNDDIDFPDENFILANKEYLIELTSRLKLWRYEGAQHAQTVGSTTFFAASSDADAGVLLAAKLPHSAALASLENAFAQSDRFVFHKGTPVKLDVSGIPDAARQNEVKDMLTKKFQAMNCPVNDEGTIDVVASIEGPKTRQIAYVRSETHQVQEFFTKLEFDYQGRTVWEAASSNIPTISQLNSGESKENVAATLREASKQPDYEFYERIALPEFLQNPSEDDRLGGSQPLGSCKVTSQGFRDL